MTDVTVVQDKMKVIATAHADYARSSFEANKAYLEKFATAKAQIKRCRSRPII